MKVSGGRTDGRTDKHDHFYNADERVNANDKNNRNKNI